MIYTFTLVQPIRWSRRHKPTCPHSPRTCNVFERPLFTYATQPCACVRRTGLALLRANRQVHAEAAPIFWSRNPHCFSLAADFVRDVGTVLRAEYRVLLRHVSVMCMAWRVNEPYGGVSGCQLPEVKAAFWRTVVECKGLERLEVHPAIAWSGAGQDVFQVVAAMPPVRSFSWQKLSYFAVNFKGEWLDYPKFQTMYCLSMKEVNMMKELASGDAMRESIRDFETNFMVHVRYAVESELLGNGRARRSSLSPVYRSFAYKLRPGLDDRSPAQTLKLRDRTTTTVQLFGLPLSPETRKHNARERYIHDVLLRKQGKQSLREQRLSDVVKVHRKEKKSKKEKQEECERQSKRNLKLLRQIDDLRWLEKSEKLEAVKRETALQESLHAAAELKKLERKRITRPR